MTVRRPEKEQGDLSLNCAAAPPGDAWTWRQIGLLPDGSQRPVFRDALTTNVLSEDDIAALSLCPNEKAAWQSVVSWHIRPCFAGKYRRCGCPIAER